MKYSVSPSGESWDDEFLEALRGLNRLALESREPVEGNAFYWDRDLRAEDQPPDQRTLARRQVLGRNAKGRVLEIGVNAGHGALLMLAAGAAEYWGVDLGAHRYTRPALGFLKGRFDAKGVIGDSAKALPVLIAEEVGPFDLIHVDGGHDLACALADLLNARQLLAPDGLVIVDDMHLPGPRGAAERMIGGNWYTGSIGEHVAQLRLP